MVRTDADTRTFIDLTRDNSVSTVPGPGHIPVIMLECLIKKDADDGAGESLQESSTKARAIRPTEQIEVAKKAKDNATRGILLQQPLAGEKCENITPIHATGSPVQEMVDPRASVSFILPLMSEDTTATENKRTRIISTRSRRKRHPVGKASFFFRCGRIFIIKWSIDIQAQSYSDSPKSEVDIIPRIAKVCDLCFLPCATHSNKAFEGHLRHT